MLVLDKVIALFNRLTNKRLSILRNGLVKINIYYNLLNSGWMVTCPNLNAAVAKTFEVVGFTLGSYPEKFPILCMPLGPKTFGKYSLHNFSLELQVVLNKLR